MAARPVDACFLARRSPVVNLVIRHGDLGRDMSRDLADRVEQSPRIKVWRNSEVSEPIGDGAPEEVLLHSFCNARQMTSPEAYIQYSPQVFRDDGEVTDGSTEEFLRAYMQEFRTYIGMVLTVLPRRQQSEDA